jgi:hypothetical protein
MIRTIRFLAGTVKLGQGFIVDNVLFPEFSLNLLSVPD